VIQQSEIVSSLAPLNGIHFEIPDLHEYAQKVTKHGASTAIRDEHSRELISFVLYYDNRPDMFITMVWTHPDHQGKGLATQLLRKIILQSTKDIYLEAHEDSPAFELYRSLGFVRIKRSGKTIVMSLQKRIAIMQPYTFPYLGYFHLTDASHLFVFYDDVHYVKRGWINRNRILLDGKEHLLTVPVAGASQNSLIVDTPLTADRKWRSKFSKTLAQAYRKAPNFSAVIELVDAVIYAGHTNISDMAIDSVVSVCNYLGTELNYTRSSTCSPDTRGLRGPDRLIRLCKDQGYKHYINAAGGKKLYERSYFSESGIELSFIDSEPVEYKQFDNAFVPWLSIIDVMMFNDVAAIRELVRKYRIS
jgi:hypothetical protein